MLAYKHKAVDKELAELKHAAEQAKLWAAITTQHMVNTLNHIRDVNELTEKIKDEIPVEEILDVTAKTE